MNLKNTSAEWKKTGKNIFILFDSFMWSLYKISQYANKSKVTERRPVIAWGRWDMEELEAGVTLGHKKTFGGDRYWLGWWFHWCLYILNIYIFKYVYHSIYLLYLSKDVNKWRKLAEIWLRNGYLDKKQKAGQETQGCFRAMINTGAVAEPASQERGSADDVTC